MPDTIRGYQEKKTLPAWAQPGRKVRFQKGALLRSMHPDKVGPYRAARAQTITVEHILSGRTVTIAHKNGAGEEPHLLEREKDLLRIAQGIGIEEPWRNITGTVRTLLDMCEHVKQGKRGDITAYKLHQSNPTLRWAGAGGYWVEVDINDCVAVEE